VDNNPVNATDPLGLAPIYDYDSELHIHPSGRRDKLAYTVRSGVSRNLEFVKRSGHPFPGPESARAHFLKTYSRGSQAYQDLRIFIHNKYVDVLAKDPARAERVAQVGRAVRRGTSPNALGNTGSSFSSARVRGGGLAIGLGALAFNSDAVAASLTESFMDFIEQKCKKNNDDWAFVSELSVRHEMNGLALFGGDVWMAGNRAQE
jgi:hypothetical protein